MHYFDHSATTPLNPHVKHFMDKVGELHFGNPSSIHFLGRKAKVIIETARKQMSTAIGCAPQEIIFTSGGTEANNLVLWNMIHKDKKHVVTSAIEHPAILKTLNYLSNFGVTYTAVAVDKNGLVDPQDVEKAIKDETGLISIMLANNEVGTIQPIATIAAIARSHGIIMHSDAVQALGKIPVIVNELGAGCLSFSAHKFYGPKGVGALFVENGIHLKPIIYGGSQEHNMRAGTENTVGISGLGLAAELAVNNIKSTTDHSQLLTETFKKLLYQVFPDAVYHGDPNGFLPGLISVSFPGYRNDLLLAHLDRKGIAVSSGSACSSGDVKPSKILSAMKVDDDLNISTLRISFGLGNTIDDVSILIKAINKSLEDIRSLS
ncbi:MAG: cysteine desulfurase family protein [Fidelibacterota bacterium]